MRTQVSETSREAFHSIRREGKLQPMQQSILDAIAGQGACTRKQLSRFTGMELSSVCGRVNSLLAAGLIEIKGEVRDEKTGKRQELIGLPMAQRDLFE